MFKSSRALSALGLALACVAPPLACSDAGGGSEPAVEWKCQIPSGAEATEYLKQIGCAADFEALASEPIDANLPGARSVKVILDQVDGDALYFQNSVLYPIHYEFASTHLSGDGRTSRPRST